MRSIWGALDRRHSLLAVAYLGMMFWLISRPELRLAPLYHAPLYAGLGFFTLQAISRGVALAAGPWARVTLTLMATAAIAVLSEWYRAPLPGRGPVLGNILLDLTGVAVLLLVCAFGTGQR